MGALLDIVSIVILVACVWSAARRGFIKTIIGLVGTLAAVVLASAFGPAAASVIRTRMVGPFFERTVGDYLMTYMSGVGDTSANSIGITYDAIVTPISEAVTNTAIASVLFIIAWDAV